MYLFQLIPRPMVKKFAQSHPQLNSAFFKKTVGPIELIYSPYATGYELLMNIINLAAMALWRQKMSCNIF